MNSQRQRGSIEVVILVVVFAVVIGLIFWRYTEAEKAQMDAENAANTEMIAEPQITNQQVEVPEMSLAFEVPLSAGDVAYDINESGAAQLKSSNLVDRSDCEDDHDGKFALLRTAGADDGNIDDNLKMRVGDVDYVVQEDYQACYSEEDRADFDDISVRIAQSLMPLQSENGETDSASTRNPDESVSNE